MGSELLSFLVEGLLTSSVAVLLVLALRRQWAHWFGATQLRLLWALIPAALLAVALPAPEQTTLAAGSLLQLELVRSNSAATAALEGAAGWGWRHVALSVWLLGSLLTAMYFAGQQRRFYRRVGSMQDRGDGIYMSQGASVGPAVLGLLHPRIVLPADFAERFSDEQQTLILAHEHSHLRRGDLFANALATLLRAVYWFNPLIHYAAWRMRHDHELASDADVVRNHPNARRRYADTLLNAQLAVPGLPVGCLWQSSHPLKERIMMLKQSESSRTRFKSTAGMAVGLSLALTVSALAWAAQPARSASDEANSKSPASMASEPASDDASHSDPSYKALSPPRYPQAAFDAKQSGRLVLKVLVSESGAPSEVVVEEASNPGVFDEAAISTVKTWTFNPGTKDGRAVASWVLVPVCFSLDESKASCPGPAAALDGIYVRQPSSKPAA